MSLSEPGKRIEMYPGSWCSRGKSPKKYEFLCLYVNFSLGSIKFGVSNIYSCLYMFKFSLNKLAGMEDDISTYE